MQIAQVQTAFRTQENCLSSEWGKNNSSSVVLVVCLLFFKDKFNTNEINDI